MYFFFTQTHRASRNGHRTWVSSHWCWSAFQSYREHILCRPTNVSLLTLMLVCIPLGMAVSQPQKFPYRSQYIKVTIGPRTHQKCPLTGLHSTWNGADVFIMRLHVFDQGCCSQKCVVGLFCLYNRSLLPFIIGLIWHWYLFWTLRLTKTRSLLPLY